MSKMEGKRGEKLQKLHKVERRVCLPKLLKADQRTGQVILLQ